MFSSKISASTSSTTPTPIPSAPLTWPFLKPDSSSPTDPNPNLVYRATPEGDLRLFLEAGAPTRISST